MTFRATILVIFSLLTASLASALESSSRSRVVFRNGGSMVVARVEDPSRPGGMHVLHLVGGGAIQVAAAQVKRVELLQAPDEPAVEESLPIADETLPPCSLALDPRVARWDGFVMAAATKHGLDPNLVRAVMAVESMGNPGAVSRKGAVGLMQLLPKTAADYGCSTLKDPQSNIEAGCQHLARLQKKLGDDRLDLVLAAYNAGEGAVSRAGDVVPAYRETQAYVSRIMACLSSSPARQPEVAN